MKSDFLDEIIGDFNAQETNAQIKATIAVVKILKEKFDCERPLKALYQIKRAMKKDRKITAAQIRKWGK